MAGPEEEPSSVEQRSAGVRSLMFAASGGLLFGIILAVLWFTAGLMRLNAAYDDFRQSVAQGSCASNGQDARERLAQVQFEFMASLSPMLKCPFRSDIWLHFGQASGSHSPCGWAKKSSQGWYLKVD